MSCRPQISTPVSLRPRPKSSLHSKPVPLRRPRDLRLVQYHMSGRSHFLFTRLKGPVYTSLGPAPKISNHGTRHMARLHKCKLNRSYAGGGHTRVLEHTSYWVVTCYGKRVVRTKGERDDPSNTTQPTNRLLDQPRRLRNLGTRPYRARKDI